MPAKHRLDHEARVIITEWGGDATVMEFIYALKEYQKNLQTHPDYLHYNELFDLTKAASIRLTVSGLIDIGRAASVTDHFFSHKKLALIVGSNFAFGLARMYEAYRNIGISSSKKIRVFKDPDKAYQWVSIKQV